MITLRGEGVSEGRACAPVMVLEAAASAHHSRTGGGLAELDRALRAAADELEAAARRASSEVSADAAAILDAQRVMLSDPELVGRIRRRIAEQGVGADEAVMEVGDELAAELRLIPDDYLRQRATDVLDVAGLIVDHLRGRRGGTLAVPEGAGEVILAARDLTPLDTVSLDRSVVRGLVTELGARNSHVAILARQLAIPAVVGVVGLLDEARAGRLLALDGDAGECVFDPRPELAKAFGGPPPAVPVVISGPVALDDGTAIEVLANAASPADVAHAVANGADGIGLYRSEFMFFGSGPVDEDTQLQAYCAAAEAADGRRVVVRTLDVGGDKPLPGVSATAEQNPFLGLRGIRHSLRHPDLFVTQVRALARAAGRFPNLEVMLPMVSGLEELDAARDLLEDAGALALRLGAMVEVPSAAVMAADLAGAAAFLSVGTNDLTQYVLAVDRTNPAVSDLYDELHPAVLRLLARIAHDAAAAGVHVGICGELAGRVDAARLLVGLGYRSLSVAAPSVGPVKAALAGASMEAAVALARDALATARAADVRKLLTRNPEATAE